MSSAGSEAQGGVGLDPAAAQAACEAAVEAQCVRQVECNEDLGPEYLSACRDLKAQCPGRFFSPGAGYTVDELNACTEVWKTFACEAYLAGERPDCTQTGTRKDGEGCRFRTQCESGVCSNDDPVVCGVCVPVVESGAACAHAEQCPDHHLCSFGYCLQRQDWPLEEELDDGEPCEYIGNCKGLCAETADGSRCVPAPMLGEPCLPPPPVAGAKRCLRGQECSPEGLCLMTPTSGPCAAGNQPCAGNLYCDGPAGLAPGECQPVLAPGSACDPAVINICGEHGFCVCDDASCSSHHCELYVRVPSMCGNGWVCSAGTECVDGACALSGNPYSGAECPAP
jgi:hypothetical protein